MPILKADIGMQLTELLHVAWKGIFDRSTLKQEDKEHRKI